MKRLSIIIVAATIAIVSSQFRAPDPAKAAPWCPPGWNACYTFGSWLRNAQTYGNSVAITAPANTLPITADEFVLFRNFNQGGPTQNAMIQAGYYRSGVNQSMSTCTSQSQWIKFAEYWNDVPNPVSACQLYGIDSPGTQTRIDIYSDYRPGRWYLDFNGTSADTWKMNYEKANPGIGGEIASTDATLSTVAGATFGDPRTWRVYNSPYQGFEQVVQQSDVSPLAYSDNWTLPALPTPFKISHS